MLIFGRGETGWPCHFLGLHAYGHYSDLWRVRYIILLDGIVLTPVYFWWNYVCPYSPLLWAPPHCTHLYAFMFRWSPPIAPPLYDRVRYFSLLILVLCAPYFLINLLFIWLYIMENRGRKYGAFSILPRYFLDEPTGHYTGFPKWRAIFWSLIIICGVIWCDYIPFFLKTA